MEEDKLLEWFKGVLELEMDDEGIEAFVGVFEEEDEENV